MTSTFKRNRHFRKVFVNKTCARAKKSDVAATFCLHSVYHLYSSVFGVIIIIILLKPRKTFFQFKKIFSVSFISGVESSLCYKDFLNSFILNSLKKILISFIFFFERFIFGFGLLSIFIKSPTDLFS